MKGLTLWQPWASLIAIGAKRVETRSWSTGYRGLIAIHAAKRFEWRDQVELLTKQPFKRVLNASGIYLASQLPLGAIVAVAEIWDCRYIDGRLREPFWMPTDPDELAFGDYSLGRWTWWMCRVQRLKEPVPCSGMQGLWNLNPRIEARVREQLEASNA